MSQTFKKAISFFLLFISVIANAQVKKTSPQVKKVSPQNKTKTKTPVSANAHFATIANIKPVSKLIPNPEIYTGDCVFDDLSVFSPDQIISTNEGTYKGKMYWVPIKTDNGYLITGNGVGHYYYDFNAYVIKELTGGGDRNFLYYMNKNDGSPDWNGGKSSYESAQWQYSKTIRGLDEFNSFTYIWIGSKDDKNFAHGLGKLITISRTTNDTSNIFIGCMHHGFMAKGNIIKFDTDKNSPSNGKREYMILDCTFFDGYWKNSGEKIEYVDDQRKEYLGAQQKIQNEKNAEYEKQRVKEQQEEKQNKNAVWNYSLKYQDENSINGCNHTHYQAKILRNNEYYGSVIITYQTCNDSMNSDAIYFDPNGSNFTYYVDPSNSNAVNIQNKMKEYLASKYKAQNFQF